MSSITYSDTVTVIPAAWLNDVDTVAYDLFGDGSSYDGILRLTGTTDATSITTGQSRNAGGASIQKALWVGGLANIAGAVTLQSTLGVTGKITATTAGIDVPTSALGTCYSGTYTPTLTNGTNVAGTTAYACQYSRVGNFVTVSGRLDINPTATGAADVGVSLPVASGLDNAQELGGTGVAPASTEAWAFSADAALNRASMNGIAVDTADHAVYFTFSYRVI